MCLANVTSVETVIHTMPKVGYKVFIPNEDGTYQTLIIAFDKPIHFGKKVVDIEHVDNCLVSRSGILYPIGFHIYDTKKGAEALARCYDDLEAVVCKVKYTEQIAEGTDWLFMDQKVVITKDFTICV